MVSEKHDEVTNKTKQMAFLAEAFDESSSTSEEEHDCPDEEKTDNELMMTEMTDNLCKCTKKEKRFKKLPLEA